MFSFLFLPLTLATLDFKTTVNVGLGKLLVKHTVVMVRQKTAEVE